MFEHETSNLKIQNKLHPELWAYDLNPDEWEKKYIHYQTRVRDWDSIVDELGPELYSWPIFTEEFCRHIIEEAEYQNIWTVDRHYHYPTTDFVLSEIGLDDIYMKILRKYAFPVARHVWGLTGDIWDKGMNAENFLAKYSPDAQGHLDSHIDSSQYSITLALNDDFVKGGTFYHRQKTLVKVEPGYVCLFPQVTHKHSGRAITKGTRYIIVSFCKSGDI
jgi:hypothetical protein